MQLSLTRSFTAMICLVRAELKSKFVPIFSYKEYKIPYIFVSSDGLGGVWCRLVVVKVPTEWRVWLSAAVVRCVLVVIHFREFCNIRVNYKELLPREVP